jgi:phosphatidate phosphatase APP1
MANWKPALEPWLARMDTVSDQARARWRRHRPSRRRRVIVPYVGFGTEAEVTVTGRVLLDDGLRPALDTDSAWRNAARFYRQLESDELPGVRVVAKLDGAVQEAVTDDEGYFEMRVASGAPAALTRWREVPLHLADAGPDDAHAIAQALVPGANARFGVISDIDDTVVQTGATDRLRMLWSLLRSNARTRKPFEGVAAFYRALQDGASGAEENPLFYVSSSPWNLYAPLVEYLDAQGIPLGPLLLKDFGDHTLFSSHDHRSHKLASIERIIATYPALPFVLIGDSGEQDPEIYADVVRAHPKRVLAVYIRSVRQDAARLSAIDALIEQVRQSGAQLVLAPDSTFAAAHAAGEGWIAAPQMHAVLDDQASDQAAQPPEAVED